MSKRNDFVNNLRDLSETDLHARIREDEQRLKKLDSIVLFSKVDLLKNKEHAIPIKVIHFEYDYTLCANVPGNSGLGVDKNGIMIPTNAIIPDAKKKKVIRML